MSILGFVIFFSVLSCCVCDFSVEFTWIFLVSKIFLRLVKEVCG